MRVCPSMRSFECLFVHLLLSPVAFCRHHGNKTKRLLWNLHQRCQFLFLFDAFKPTETVFFKDKKVIGAKIVQYFTVLPCLSFVRSLADVFLVELDQSGLDLGCSHHYSQYSGTQWMYCCKYIVTHSYAVTVDSLHMYY